ncbi:hypothetical protein J31TS4_17710 [Paenibacillus sp. J31TS4]|uniref:hypothetical protein n=1 Tax=Paenibacillus sp. J31TS4 TaxID=2807195 RepID=UPI001B02563E|nr:hypothetical protein [Paenibacillus sp. J31TS4]GIP38491.1 hypothetical protein J31TS4_17710 [Paenibacillus sp. J31TS4]
MKQLKPALGMELLLLARGKGWLLPVLLHAAYWLFVADRYELRPPEGLTRMVSYYDSLLIAMPAAALFCGLLGVFVLQRDKHNGLHRLALSWSVAKTPWLGSKWLAVQLYGLAFVLPAVLLQAVWFLVDEADTDRLPAYLCYTLLQMGGAVSFSGSLGFLIGLLVRSRLAYLVLPLLWLVPIYVETSFHSSPSQMSVFWRWAAPYDLTQFHYQIASNLWGIRGIPVTALHQLFVWLAGLTAGAWSLLLYRKDRVTPRERRGLPLLAAALLLPAVIAGACSLDELSGRLIRYLDTASFTRTGTSQQPDDYAAIPVESEFRVRETELTLRFPGTNELAADASLLLELTEREEASSVVLTLYRRLEVSELTADRPIEWSREGDVLRVKTRTPVRQGERLRLRLVYRGPVDEYRDEGLTAYSFADRQAVHLPKPLAWYPQPGERMITKTFDHNGAYYGVQMQPGSAYIEPGESHYKVRLLDGMPGQAVLPIPMTEPGVYEGDSSFGLFLAAGRFAERETGGVRVVSQPERLAADVRSVESQLDAIAFLNEWLGLSYKPSRLYSELILEGAPLDPYREGSELLYPFYRVPVPEVEELRLRVLLNWLYEKRLPTPRTRQGESYTDAYAQMLSLQGGGPRPLTAEEEAFARAVDETAGEGEDKAYQLAASLYRAYEEAGTGEAFDPLAALRRQEAAGKGGAR